MRKVASPFVSPFVLVFLFIICISFVSSVGGSSGECLPNVNYYIMNEGDYVQFGSTTFKLLKIYNGFLIDYIDVDVEGTKNRVYSLIPKNVENLKLSFPIVIGNSVKVKVELTECVIVPELDEIDYKTILSNNEHSEFFSNQMTSLMSEYWSEDGNWIGDMQNDATAFAPQLMFKLYQETGNEEFYARGMKTVNYQKELLKGFVEGEGELNLDFMVGFYSVFSCMDYAKDKITRDSCSLFAGSVITALDYILINDVLDRIPETYTLKHSDNTDLSKSIDLSEVYSEDMQSFVYSFASWVSSEYYERTKVNLFLSNAEKLIEKNENNNFNSSTGLFKGSSGGWSESAPLIAYSKIYLVTKDEVYLNKADNLIESLKRERKFIDYEESAFADYYAGGGTYCDQWGNCEYVEVPVNDYPTTGFSTHIQYIIAFFELYKATNDPKYLELSKNFIDFGVNQMNLYGAYPNGIYDQWLNKIQRVPFVSHHIFYTRDDSFDLGRILVNSQSYCTGDNFYLLIDLLDYKEFSKLDEIGEGNCGNGIINGGEVCDGDSKECVDSNGYSGSQSCNIQCDGFDSCTANEYCGDNTVNGNEQCDDGNKVNGDGCSSFCLIEYSQICVDNDGFNTAIASSVEFEGKEYVDSCVDDKTVKENYCGFSIWKMSRIHKESIKSCEFNCENGACVGQEEVVYEVCKDSDVTNDVSIKGSVDFEGNNFDDECAESGLSVRQYFCDSNQKLRNFVKRCPERLFCNEGVCK
ncbi:hypothetical protein AUJ62_01415 [Candidatus Pacearchaeota archaeon CG1_02_32_21]|nr:MAG: hypothetical protein AUJ62_01415 [Candidatus Pacearchaeota archaeon CG1_02_32_21]